MAYLSGAVQRQRIIGVVRKEALVDCATLVVERLENAGHAVTVFFWCKEEDAEKDELVQGLILAGEDAEYIGLSLRGQGRMPGLSLLALIHRSS